MFAERLEKASVKTIEEGVMTRDLIQLSSLTDKVAVGTEEFLYEIKKRLNY